MQTDSKETIEKPADSEEIVEKIVEPAEPIDVGEIQHGGGWSIGVSTFSWRIYNIGLEPSPGDLSTIPENDEQCMLSTISNGTVY